MEKYFFEDNSAEMKSDLPFFMVMNPRIFISESSRIW
jgi:hypothetical protein